MAKRKSCYENIYAIVKRIPKGKVATYGLIAQIEGTCTARMVGYALSNAKPEMLLPWHRVINSNGSISLKAPEEYALQRELLENEGVVFKSSRIDLKTFLWKP
ncbi:MAG: MGMT family protein [Thermotogota bacterium]